MKKIILLSMIFILGCGFSLFKNGKKAINKKSPEASNKVEKNIPKWYRDVPEKKGMRRAKGTDTSTDMGYAERKSFVAAGTQLGVQIKAEYKDHRDKVAEEIGSGFNQELLKTYKDLQELNAVEIISDVEIWKDHTQEERANILNKEGVMVEKSIWRSYCVVEIDEGRVAKKLRDKIQKDKRLDDAIRSTEVYEEMNEKIDDYIKRTQETTE